MVFGLFSCSATTSLPRFRDLADQRFWRAEMRGVATGGRQHRPGNGLRLARPTVGNLCTACRAQHASGESSSAPSIGTMRGCAWRRNVRYDPAERPRL
ncbi:MAG: hypothetical protein ACR2GH_12895 [Pseudonocardia sp.]